MVSNLLWIIAMSSLKPFTSLVELGACRPLSLPRITTALQGKTRLDISK